VNLSTDQGQSLRELNPFPAPADGVLHGMAVLCGRTRSSARTHLWLPRVRHQIPFFRFFDPSTL